MPAPSLVACPKCGHRFSVEEVLSHELEESIKARYEKQQEKVRADFERQKGLLEKQSEERRKTEREKLLKDAQKRAIAEVQAEMKALNDEAENTRKQLQALKKT